MTWMFQYCNLLTTIYVGASWEIDQVTRSGDMFYGCKKLPNFNSSVVDKTNAHFGQGGYLTYKEN